MKIQIKIAILFTLLCTFIMVALSFAVYYFANERAFQDFYTRLELRATIAAKAAFDVDTVNTAAYEMIRRQHLQQLPDESETIVPVDSLQILTSIKENENVPQQFYEDILKRGEASYRDDDRFYKGIHYQSPSGDYVVMISAVHQFARNFLNRLRNILITTNLVSMVVIFILGVLFSKRILAPIRKITREVKDISATSLHNRLTVNDGKDEIAELGSTFNDMISRLETAFETQNNFVSNASHELNTPLTTIIGEAELALSRTRTTEQYQQVLQTILVQGGRLKDIIRSLLELAQSGFRGSLSFETVRIDELLHNVQKVAKSMYPESNLVFDFSLLPAGLNTLSVKGSSNLLELCLSNIVLNACKYSAGDKVVVALATTNKFIIFIVRDKGIGIPERDLPYIFDPFFRASNVKGAKGYGIGLPLAQNIIKLHKGIIQVASKEAEGTEVVIKLPKEFTK